MPTNKTKSKSKRFPSTKDVRSISKSMVKSEPKTINPLKKRTKLAKPDTDRIFAVDFIRLTAIITMILAHTVSFLYRGNDPIILLLRDFGNIVSFSVFLFISGVSTYLGLISLTDSKFKERGIYRKWINRLADLLAVYYLLAFALSVPNLMEHLSPNGGGVSNVAIDALKIITFQKLVGYTEFFVPFLLFGLAALIFRKYVRKIVLNPLLLIGIATILFATGSIISNNFDSIFINEIISNYAVLIFGRAETYSFPLAQYSFVFLMGLGLGHIIKDRKETKAEYLAETITIFFLGVAIVIDLFMEGPVELFKRWPPSLGFISIGIVWIGLLFILFWRNQYLRKKIDVLMQNSLLQLLSRSSLKSVAVNSLILLVIEKGFNITVSTNLEIVILILLSFTLTIVFIIISSYLGSNFTSKLRIDYTKVFSPKGYSALQLAMLSAIVFTIAFVALISTSPWNNNAQNDVPVELTPLEKIEQDRGKWFSNYAHTRIVVPLRIIEEINDAAESNTINEQGSENQADNVNSEVDITYATEYLKLTLPDSLTSEEILAIVIDDKQSEKLLEKAHLGENEQIIYVRKTDILDNSSNISDQKIFLYFTTFDKAKIQLKTNLEKIAGGNINSKSFEIDLEKNTGAYTIEKSAIELAASRKWLIPGDKVTLTFTLPDGISQAATIVPSCSLVTVTSEETKNDCPFTFSNVDNEQNLLWEVARVYEFTATSEKQQYNAYQFWIEIVTNEQEFIQTLNPLLGNLPNYEKLSIVESNEETINPGNSSDPGAGNVADVADVTDPLDIVENNLADNTNRYYKIKSNSIPINYTAPLFMTWTIDWEGFDLTDKYWQQLKDLSDNNGIPMTHYFNPRIYTNLAISESRRNTLTNWVKERAKQGEEISLHLHMHYDMVEAAGLEAKTEPAWGGRVEGHDVLTTAYDYDEFRQIIEWALAEFTRRGLPDPVGYRAGGWFLDMDNMRVLEDLGFTYDTSGSDYLAPYGPNKQSRDWSLNENRKPYQVGRSNINSSQPPKFKIWEYPNNGADSTNRTAEELIRRLELNLNRDLLPGLSTQSKILTQSNVLTYLTHPHWMHIDGPKLERLFAESNKSNYASNLGPVVYVTQIDAHKRYTSLQKAQ